MSRESKKILCDCGCGRSDYHSRLREVVVEEAIDETLRQSQTKARFWVRAECKEAFEEELQCMTCLQLIVRAFPPAPQTPFWLINAWLNPFYPWPRLLKTWWRRVGGSLRVMRLQHAIHERTKGFEYSRVRAKQSAILFGAPRFLQGFLARRFTKSLQAAEAKLAQERADLAARMELEEDWRRERHAAGQNSR